MARAPLAALLAAALVGAAGAMVAPRAPVHARAVVRPAPPSTISMKIFDWKRRSDTYEEETDLRLHNLRPSPGSNKRKIRKGRGMGTGKGGPCGFGMRGQRSRSGRPSPPGFEGGQTPLYRRIPKLRGKPTGPGHTKKEYGLIKIDYLNKMPDNAEVSYDALLSAGHMTKVKPSTYGIKVVGGTEALAKQGLVVKAHAFTAAARAAIEANGGTCIEVPRTAPKEAATADSS